jgi:hypothetical protein
MSKPITEDQPKPVQVDEEKLAQTIARHAELQQQLEQLISSWEAERSQLRTKIVQLEHSLVDAIERSNNPLRSAQLSDEKIRLLEEAKREWSAQWSAERDQLMAEIQRLRQLATSILGSNSRDPLVRVAHREAS